MAIADVHVLVELCTHHSFRPIPQVCLACDFLQRSDSAREGHTDGCSGVELEDRHGAFFPYILVDPLRSSIRHFAILIYMPCGDYGTPSDRTLKPWAAVMCEAFVCVRGMLNVCRCVSCLCVSECCVVCVRCLE